MINQMLLRFPTRQSGNILVRAAISKDVIRVPKLCQILNRQIFNVT
jgi:hypothetical protein